MHTYRTLTVQVGTQKQQCNVDRQKKMHVHCAYLVRRLWSQTKPVSSRDKIICERVYNGRV